MNKLVWDFCLRRMTCLTYPKSAPEWPRPFDCHERSLTSIICKTSLHTLHVYNYITYNIYDSTYMYLSYFIKEIENGHPVFISADANTCTWESFVEFENYNINKYTYVNQICLWLGFMHINFQILPNLVCMRLYKYKQSFSIF